jgi:hypothetical protein
MNKESKREASKEKSLRDWFGRKGAKGSKGGWVDCNAPDGDGGYRACGRSSGEKRKRYPACRPTPGACKEKGKGKSWGKKGKKKSMLLSDSLELFVKDAKKKKKKKDDACTRKVKARYDVWPSAYASGAVTKCRQVGAANWGNKSKKKSSYMQLTDALSSFVEKTAAEYQGKKVTLNKPTRGDVKKFKVYVKDPSTGNVKKVNFGDPNMKIRKSNPKARKSFRARHNCDNPGPKTKARYWSCKKW